MLSRNPREIVVEDDMNVVFAVLGEEEEMKEQSWHFLRRRNHPLFAKYYNKLALGAKEEEVKEQMAGEGVDPRVGEDGAMKCRCWKRIRTSGSLCHSGGVCSTRRMQSVITRNGQTESLIG